MRLQMAHLLGHTAACLTKLRKLALRIAYAAPVSALAVPPVAAATGGI
jgi:hypothetical protein